MRLSTIFVASALSFAGLGSALPVAGKNVLTARFADSDVLYVHGNSCPWHETHACLLTGPNSMREHSRKNSSSSFVAIVSQKPEVTKTARMATHRNTRSLRRTPLLVTMALPLPSTLTGRAPATQTTTNRPLQVEAVTAEILLKGLPVGAAPALS